MPGLHFLYVAQRLVAQNIVGGEGNGAHSGVYEGYGAVLHLPCRVALGMNVADFLELQGPLRGDGGAGSPSQEQEVSVMPDPVGQLAVAVSLRQQIADEPGAAGQLVHQAAGSCVVETAAGAAQVYGQQVQDGQGGDEGLGAGNAYFQPSPHIERAVGDAGGLAFLGVADGDQRRALLAGQVHRRHGVGGLARLPDGDHQRARADQRVAVAELRCALGLGRDAGQPLDVMAAHLRRVKAGAAADEHHPLQCADGGGRQRETGQFHTPFGEIGTVSQCGGHGLRLVHNFLEHEVAVAALVHQHVVAGDPARLLDDGVAV